MPFSRFQQKKWTKADIFERLDAHSLSNMSQIWAGCFFMRLTPKNIELLELWRSLCYEDHLVDDSPSKTENYTGFIQNRHDQSILSILMYKQDAFVIHDESKTVASLMTAGLASGPILDTRIRGSAKGPVTSLPLTYTGLQILILAMYFILIIILLLYIKQIFKRTTKRPTVRFA